jgi:hypothetical protein
VSLAKSASAASTSARDRATASPVAAGGPALAGRTAALEATGAAVGGAALAGRASAAGEACANDSLGAAGAGANSDDLGFRPSCAPAPPLSTSAIARADSVCWSDGGGALSGEVPCAAVGALAVDDERSRAALGFLGSGAAVGPVPCDGACAVVGAPAIDDASAAVGVARRAASSAVVGA